MPAPPTPNAASRHSTVNRLYDVLIVGAGPAGNTAAYHLAKAGLNVGVLDYRRRIGDKLCTGVIGAECAEKFPVPGNLVYREARSAVIHSPRGRAYRVQRPSQQALIVDRVAYVNRIAESAAELGADFRLGYRATGLTQCRTGVVVRADLAGSSERFEGRILMIATGFGSGLARLAGLRDGTGQEYLLGHQMVVEAADLAEIEVYVGDTTALHSFGWLVPTSGSEALLGVISRYRSRSYLERLKGKLRLRGAVVRDGGEIKTWGVPLKPLPKTYGYRTMVLGDAAGLAKPTTGGGIYYGMLSGQIAAQTAVEALESGDLSNGRLRSYEDRWKRELASEIRIGYYARMLFESMDDDQLEQLMEVFLSDQGQREMVNLPDMSFDRHGTTILRTVGNRKICRLIASFGPSTAPLMARLVRSAIFV